MIEDVFLQWFLADDIHLWLSEIHSHSLLSLSLVYYHYKVFYEVPQGAQGILKWQNLFVAHFQTEIIYEHFPHKLAFFTKSKAYRTMSLENLSSIH